MEWYWILLGGIIIGIILMEVYFGIGFELEKRGKMR